MPKKIIERKNLFVEMVQVYLDYKKIDAKATINTEGFLAVLVDMTTNDSKKLSQLLSRCMPISYVMTNTTKTKPKPITKPKPKVAEKSKPKANFESKPKPKSKPKKVKLDSYIITDLVIDYRAKEWCKYSYHPLKDKNGRLKRDRNGKIKYQYPNGCPNYNKSKSCPPNSLKIEDVIDVTNKMWFMVAKFNLKKHFDEQKFKYPDWSDRQCRNSRHWQNSVVSQLTKACNKFVAKTDMIYDLKPESLGVNVFKSMKNLEIILEKRPKNFIHKVAIIGIPKNNNTNKEDSNKLLTYFEG